MHQTAEACIRLCLCLRSNEVRKRFLQLLLVRLAHPQPSLVCASECGDGEGSGSGGGSGGGGGGGEGHSGAGGAGGGGRVARQPCGKHSKALMSTLHLVPFPTNEFVF